jgi:DNA-binding PadR family transcriptional regulator
MTVNNLFTNTRELVEWVFRHSLQSAVPYTMTIDTLNKLEQALRDKSPLYVWISADEVRWFVTTSPAVYTFRLTEEGARLLLRFRWRRERALAGAIADWLEENRSLLLSSCSQTDAGERLDFLVKQMNAHFNSGAST